ncbi:MAG TPA: AAA family ATPase [Pyrinomonadaceae bacterium]|jgi:LuxR family maltose regulon positive regulatory protein
MQVIHDKVAAPLQNPRVSRPRLLRMLGEGLDSCTATVITGRAGAGKTLLAKDFARGCGRRAAWYTVEAHDIELPIFFRYLVESVSRQCPGFGREVLANLAGSPGFDDIPTLAEAFIYELQECRDEPLMMVVDDLHLVYDALWLVPFFSRLLPLLPPEAHMLIVGRSLPPTPVWRMRSKQTLCLVEEAALAFTPEEAAELFAAYGLAGRDARAALEESQGRAATLDGIARRMSGEDGGRCECGRLRDSVEAGPPPC